MMLTEKGRIALQYLEQYKDKNLPSKTLAGIMVKDYPEVFKTIENARNSVRYYRGNIGNKDRKKLTNRTYMRPNQPAGYVTKIPKTKYKNWLPFEINHKRNLILADAHIPYHDVKALEAALKFGDEYKPNSIILNGDIIDCFALSRYLKNPKERDFAGEILAVRGFLDHLRERFSKTVIYYKLGNHEERYEHFLWLKSEELIGLPDFELKHILEFVDKNIIAIEDRRIINLGQLPILHGNEYRQGISSPVNPARGLFLKTKHSCMASHLHQTSDHTEPTLSGKLIVTWSTGCLCGLHPDYARLNRWNHGFATVSVKPNGDYFVSNYRILDGKVLN
jgi:predicted phosphodiesterase